MKRLFRVSAWVLLAAVSAAGTATHRHTDFGDEDDARSEQRVVSAHDPSSRALHLHAVLRVVEDAPCWACHSHRLSTLAAATPAPRPLFVSRPLGTLPPRAALSVARYTRPSRAPPSPRGLEI